MSEYSLPISLFVRTQHQSVHVHVHVDTHTCTLRVEPSKLVLDRV